MDRESPHGAQSAQKRTRLGLRAKITYGMGDFSSQLVWTTTSTYLAIFYTNAVGLPTASVGVLLLVARILDAVIDPVFGAIMERTRSRFGRFRPWILYGTVPLAVLLVLTFTSLPTADQAVKMLWAVATYSLLGILYSAVNLPIGALAGVLSNDPKDRVALGSVRMIGANAGIVLLSFVTVPLIVVFSGHTGAMTARGYTFTALVMAVVATGLLLAVFATCREVVTPVAAVMPSIRTTLMVTARNRPLLLIALAFLFGMIGFFGRLGVSVYYLIYDVRNSGLVAVLMAAPAVAAVVGMLVLAPLAKRWEKRNVVVVSLVWQSLALGALYLVGFGNVAVVAALTLVYGLGYFGFPVLIGMVADAIDYGEATTGVRADGTAYAVISVGTKVASAIGGALTVTLLGVFGYVANHRQTEVAMAGINLVTNIVTGLCILVAAVPMIFYKLTDTDALALRAQLDDSTAASPASESALR